MSDAAQVLARVDSLRDELVATLAEAIAVRSVNPTYAGQDYNDLVGGESDVARLLAGAYRQSGAETELFGEVPGRDNVVGVLRGSGRGQSLIFNGHLDVVPADDGAEWTHDPFSGFHDETHVWGRGAVDMKSGLVAQAFAAKALHESGVRLRGDLLLQGVVGEENLEHHLGTSAVLGRGYTADGAIIAEPTGSRRSLSVMPATPGVLVMRITVAGRSGHASARALMRAQANVSPAAEPVAVSAIDAALTIHEGLRRLESEWELTRTDPLFERGQFTIGLDVIDGGARSARNVAFIPDQAVLDYAVFYPPADDVAEVQADIVRTVSAVAEADPWLRREPPRIEWPMHYPGGRTDRDHPLCRTVISARQDAASESSFSGPPDVLPFPSAADLPWFTAAGIPAVGMGPGALAMAHAVNERCAIEEIVCATKAYALTAMRWCGTQ
ncbi:M20/M25/M40 family metallo-hydrolase [Mycobacteroides abscessus]|uniref:M20 family metallopeptidase n=1 Tax=Mycobacteroides abscessus TaxID=36809 RepID=UPI0021D79B45|nr:M20/M25/M40 family metallo-hydrolase [Mycobacteroides abscessus]MCU8693584.1 M20/M25/M40 family metallo-hydrolase [Mycobacteroides abscessus]MCU8712792.1 M20/M25/M40 family metallo-hydrolase [Mycobacteroides abscessus]MCU8717538.1 M20/M25/M40 family metallo-hydrolase [Mycobacteroides abscessus]MCU8751226.1 M20/M25/M40 family metallo-hydrolase [Mycobacteroides abscessus]MCU8759828.1 M20/M25/M40 family metallo-hydrolase [Mycobacteroides abscessus]